MRVVITNEGHLWAFLREWVGGFGWKGWGLAVMFWRISGWIPLYVVFGCVECCGGSGLCLSCCLWRWCQ